MLPTARKLAFTDVPEIDLAPVLGERSAARRAVAEQMAEVCGRVGFMYKQEPSSQRRRHCRYLQDRRETSITFRSKRSMEVSLTKNNHAQGYLACMVHQGQREEHLEIFAEVFQIRRPLADDDPDLLAGKLIHGKISVRARCLTFSCA